MKQVNCSFEPIKLFIYRNFVFSGNCLLPINIILLENYMKSINLTSEIDVDEIKNLNLTYNEYDIPFGYLESDWKRMLLLQSKQPKDSYLSENLIKLLKLY